MPERPGHAASGSFAFRESGRILPRAGARDAITLPTKALGVAIEPAAVDFVVDYTRGYPYFLREYGRIVWDEAPASPITRADVESILPLVEAELDESVFWVRAERATDLELRYLYALAGLGPDPHGATEVAARIDRTAEQAGPIRSRLIDKVLLYAPGRGYAAFTVPQFDRYMLRCHAGLSDAGR